MLLEVFSWLLREDKFLYKHSYYSIFYTTKLELNFIDSEETVSLRGKIGQLISNLESVAHNIYSQEGHNESVAGALDISGLPEYREAVRALSKLREATTKAYHELYGIPLEDGTN